jgi:hypothetical protein
LYFRPPTRKVFGQIISRLVDDPSLTNPRGWLLRQKHPRAVV